jgi:hypothetical protein
VQFYVVTSGQILIPILILVLMVRLTAYRLVRVVDEIERVQSGNGQERPKMLFELMIPEGRATGFCSSAPRSTAMTASEAEQKPDEPEDPPLTPQNRSYTDQRSPFFWFDIIPFARGCQCPQCR